MEKWKPRDRNRLENNVILELNKTVQSIEQQALKEQVLEIPSRLSTSSVSKGLAR